MAQQNEEDLTHNLEQNPQTDDSKKNSKEELEKLLTQEKVALPQKKNHFEFFCGRVGTMKGVYGIFYAKNGFHINMNINKMVMFASRVRTIKDSEAKNASFLYPLQNDDGAYLATSSRSRQGSIRANTVSYKYLRIRNEGQKILLFQRDFTVRAVDGLFQKGNNISSYGILMSFSQFLSVCDFFVPLETTTSDEVPFEDDVNDI